MFYNILCHFYTLFVRLFHRNVGIDVLGTDESVVQDVGCAEQRNPIRGEVTACPVGYEALDSHHDVETADHGHEGAGGDGGVLAKALGGEVEDAAPHDAGAEADEEEAEDADGTSPQRTAMLV